MFRKRNLPFSIGKDERIKIMSERINITERNLANLYSSFGSYTRKLARYRDKNDDLAKSFDSYSNDEIINKTLSTGMKSFSKALTILADYIDSEVHRIELKITNEILQYEHICKNARENLRTSVHLRDKEVARQNQLIDIKSKFVANSSAADSELMKAKLEVNKSNKQIDEIIDNFEKQKLHDIKNIILNFIMIQIKQYTKSIEILSAAYYDISNINEKQDFQEFKKAVKMKEKTKKLYFKNEFRSQSLEHLDIPTILTPTRVRRGRYSNSTKDLSTTITEDEEGQDDSDEDESEEEEKTDSSINDNESQSENEFIAKTTSETNSENQMAQKFRIRKGIPTTSLNDNKNKLLLPTATTMNVKSINGGGDSSGITKYQPINFALANKRNK